MRSRKSNGQRPIEPSAVTLCGVPITRVEKSDVRSSAAHSRDQLEDASPADP